MPFSIPNLPVKWVLPSALIFLFLMMAIIELPMLHLTHGLILYPQDDGYIRMDIAKSLTSRHLWGVSSNEFSSASSSILYPIILAIFFALFGPQLWIPLVINIGAGVLFLIVVNRWLNLQFISSWSRFLILVSVIWFTPLHVVIALGMEHTIQMLLSFLFIAKFFEWYSSASHRIPWNAVVYAVLLTSVRYEGLFIVFVGSLALIIRRRWSLVILIVGSSLLPLLLFGIYSIYHGGYFIPQSLIIKNFPLPVNGENIWKFFTDGLINRLFYMYPTRGGLAVNRLLICLPLLYWVCKERFQDHRLYNYIFLFCIAMVILHAGLTNTILYYRYEAYIMSCSVIIVGVVIARGGIDFHMIRYRSLGWVAAWMVIFLFYPLMSRSWQAMEETDLGFHHEYLVNYQAARFIQRYYPNTTMLMDEAGIISFFSDGRKLDISTGIIFRDISESRINGYNPLEYIDFLINKEKPVIAMISDDRYHPWLRRNWKYEGLWFTRYKIVNGDTKLSFYAVDPRAAAMLRNNIHQFTSDLPPDVKVVYNSE